MPNGLGSLKTDNQNSISLLFTYSVSLSLSDQYLDPLSINAYIALVISWLTGPMARQGQGKHSNLKSAFLGVVRETRDTRMEVANVASVHDLSDRPNQPASFNFPKRKFGQSKLVFGVFNQPG